MLSLPQLTEQLVFPPVEQAHKTPNGLLAYGGDLSAQRLLLAYRSGIFPWFNEGEPILWWSPHPRMVLFPQAFHVSRSLAKSVRRDRWRISVNQDFAQIIHQCAEQRRTAAGTWITPAMQAAYLHLHQLGHAHSIEVWRDHRLVGGLYGVNIGEVFFAESMFSLVSNASKIALASLAFTMQAHAQHGLIDCQIYSDHLARLGAYEIKRADFLAHLQQATPAPQWISTVQHWKLDRSCPLSPRSTQL